MDKSVLKELDSKATLAMPSKKPHGTPEMVIKGERRPFGCAHHKTRKTNNTVQNPLNTETEGEGGVGGIGIVRINRVGFIENVRGFLHQGAKQTTRNNEVPILRPGRGGLSL